LPVYCRRIRSADVGRGHHSKLPNHAANLSKGRWKAISAIAV
jgi:hypothetical protein